MVLSLFRLFFGYRHLTRTFANFTGLSRWLLLSFSIAKGTTLVADDPVPAQAFAPLI
jgi:hypothetical protein